MLTKHDCIMILYRVILILGIWFKFIADNNSVAIETYL